MTYYLTCVQWDWRTILLTYSQGEGRLAYLRLAAGRTRIIRAEGAGIEDPSAYHRIVQRGAVVAHSIPGLTLIEEPLLCCLVVRGDRGAQARAELWSGAFAADRTACPIPLVHATRVALLTQPAKPNARHCFQAGASRVGGGELRPGSSAPCAPALVQLAAQGVTDEKHVRSSQAATKLSGLKQSWLSLSGGRQLTGCPPAVLPGRILLCTTLDSFLPLVRVSQVPQRIGWLVASVEPDPHERTLVQGPVEKSLTISYAYRTADRRDIFFARPTAETYFSSLTQSD